MRIMWEGKRGSKMFKAPFESRTQIGCNVGFSLKGRLSKLLLMTTFAFIVASCAAPSPPGKSASMSVSDVQQGELQKDLPVRWGGTIVQVQNKADITVIEIVSRPLMASGRPKHNDATDGRFIAEIKGFIDPEIVLPGRDISAIGKISRVEKGLVGEAVYDYPVMDVFEHRFWSKQVPLDRSDEPRYLFPERYWDDWPHRRSSVHGLIIF